MKNSILFPTISAAAFATCMTIITPAVNADDAPSLSYSFIEAGYLSTRNGLKGSIQDGTTAIDFASADTDGFFGRLSYQFNDTMYAWGDFTQNKYKLAVSAQNGTTITEAAFRLKPRRYLGGIGFFHKVEESLHLFAEGGVSVTHFKIRTTGVNAGTNGNVFSVVDTVGEETKIHGIAKAGIRYMSEFGLELNLAGSWAGDSRIKANETGDDLRIADEIAGEAGLRYHFNDRFSLGAAYRRTSENSLLGSVRFSF